MDLFPGDQVPDLRTVQRWVREAAGGGPIWTLAGTTMPAADAALVLAALGTLAYASGGRRAAISDAEAIWTVRIARAAPTIDPFVAYQVGKLYSDRSARGQETRSMDVYLGAAPWADPGPYLSIIENGGVDEWFGLGWHPPLDLVVQRHYAKQSLTQSLTPPDATGSDRAKGPGDMP